MSTRLRLAALLLAIPLAVTACSSGGDHAAPSSTAASTSSGPGRSPQVVAASAVGTRSRTQVLTLHALGVATTTRGTLPRTQLPGQGDSLAATLRAQAADASRLPAPSGSAADQLVRALRTYAGLADELGRWNPDGPALPAGWFTRLRATDATWTAALRGLSGLTGTDLLAGLPSLALPTRSPR